MQQITITIINKLGLHARAAAKLTQLASNFDSQIWLMHNNKRVNAKSIMEVMMLAAAADSSITIETEGIDEAAAIDAIIALFTQKFGEIS